MTEMVPTTTARCSDCAKVYRIPADADQTYRCKACGGEVTRGSVPGSTPGSSEGRGVIAGTVECSECQAIQPRGLHFCAECGTSLDYEEGVPTSPAVDRMRHEAAHALKRAMRLIGGVTWLFRVGAAAYAVATLMAILALGRPEIPREGGVVVVGLTTLLGVLLLVGSLHLHFQPVLWTALVASLSTGVTVVHQVGPNPLDMAFLASLCWTTLAWGMLFPAIRFQQLVAHHRDLYILHHAGAATRRSLRGRSGHERHERLLAAMRRAARRTWKLSTTLAVALVALSVAGTWGILTRVRPVEIGPSLERFVQAWESERWEEIDALSDPRLKGDFGGQLRASLTTLGWIEEAPDLREASREPRESGCHVTYQVGDSMLEADWTQADQSWRLVDLELPTLPLEPEIERLLTAWRDSDVEGIVQLFRPYKHDEVRSTITAAMEGRGWLPTPSIERHELQRFDEREARLRCFIGKKELACDWFLARDGHWRLTGLIFPER